VGKRWASFLKIMLLDLSLYLIIMIITNNIIKTNQRVMKNVLSNDLILTNKDLICVQPFFVNEAQAAERLKSY